MWWDEFKVGTLVSTTSIQEISRFVNESVTRVDSQVNRNSAAHHLLKLFETADLHFQVDVTDTQGSIITSAMQEILGTDIAAKELWQPHLAALSLLMAERLVAYRQDTDPSDALTAKLGRFINGLRQYVVLDCSNSLTDAAAQRWTSLVERISKPREKMADPKWHRSLTRASTTPLAQTKAYGTAINNDIQSHRKKRASDSAIWIFELQDREIDTLTRLRSRLERSIEKTDASQGTVSLHRRCPKHLFTAKSYYEVDSEIDVVMRSKSSERLAAIVLLQKKFEYLALLEVSQLLRNASTCYNKILGILNSAKPLPTRCMNMLEQISELYWLQRRTLNHPHSDVKVHSATFRTYARSLALVDKSDDTNTDMWSPSLLKLEDMVRDGRVTGDAAEYLYDVILANKYKSADELRHSVGTLVAVTPGSALTPPTAAAPAAGAAAGATVSYSSAISVFPGTYTAPHHDGDVVVAHDADLLKVVERMRNAVRDLLRTTQQTAATLQRTATVMDASVATVGPFVESVLLPFLAPITAQWNTCIEAYLKPLTSEHENEHSLAEALKLVRQEQFLRNQPRTDLHSVGVTLSSSGVLVLQGLKVFRLFTQMGAVFVAQKVFNESYMRKVFAEGRAPPPLTSMLFLMLSVDATAHLMAVLVLVLASFAFKTETNTFLIDELFLAEVLSEFAVSSLVLIILGVMLADTLRRKRYFQYADQGQVVSKAYRSALIYVCVFNFVVPFSMLVS